MLEDIGDKLRTKRRYERGVAVNLERFLPAELHAVTIKPGACRGSRVHGKDEVICVVGGHSKCEVAKKCDASGDAERIVVENNR